MGSRRAYPMRAGVYKVNCGLARHTVRINKKGRVRLMDHDFSVQEALKEFDFLSREKAPRTGCLSVAGFVAGRIAECPVWDYHGSNRCPSMTRSDRLDERFRHETILKTAHPLLQEKVLSAVKGSKLYQQSSLTFFTEVIMAGPSSITRTGNDVKVRVNGKRWACLYLLRATVVEGFFILDRVKARSRTDLEVRFMKRAKGTNIVEAVGNIRLGSDRRWRFSR